MSELLTNYDRNNLVKNKTCFQNPGNARYIDLVIANSIASFQNTTTVATGWSDFDIMIVAVCKTSFPNLGLKKLFTVTVWNLAWIHFKGN